MYRSVFMLTNSTSHQAQTNSRLVIFNFKQVYQGFTLDAEFEYLHILHSEVLQCSRHEWREDFRKYLKLCLDYGLRGPRALNVKTEF